MIPTFSLKLIVFGLKGNKFHLLAKIKVSEQMFHSVGNKFDYGLIRVS